MSRSGQGQLISLAEGTGSPVQTKGGGSERSLGECIVDKKTQPLHTCGTMRVQGVHRVEMNNSNWSATLIDSNSAQCRLVPPLTAPCKATFFRNQIIWGL